MRPLAGLHHPRRDAGGGAAENSSRKKELLTWDDGLKQRRRERPCEAVVRGGGVGWVAPPVLGARHPRPPSVLAGPARRGQLETQPTR